MSLRLVELGYTGAAMFAANGEVLQACEYLRKKSVVVHRGRFRPLTHVNVDILHCAETQFEEDHPGSEHIALMEITMHHLSPDGDVDLKDFIARVDVLSATGHTVLISDFLHFHQLAQYLRSSGVKRTGLAVGLDIMRNLLPKEQSQSALASFGALLQDDLNLYVYPAKNFESGQIETVDDLDLGDANKMLLGYLKLTGVLTLLENYDKSILNIRSEDVLALIAANDERWEQLVPTSTVDIIQQRRLFTG